MSDSPTSTLGKYQIIREIARSNDIVFEAYDPVMNRRVALKELAMPAGATPQLREDRTRRFLREAKAAGSLAHPNIVTIYECGEDAGRHFIAMEYLEGHTLRNELDTHGFLSPDRSFEIAKAVLQALDYAHSRGVIHRDIKPDNIQLLPDGSVKITDFGIARLTFEPNLTIDGQVFGTPSYMSPEQVVGRDIDARSDVFSVGVLLYEMLSGSKPFPGDSVVTITYGIINKEPIQPQQVSYPVWQVLSRAMEKSPQLRYATAGEMLAALEQAHHASKSVVLDSGPASVAPWGMAPGSGMVNPGPPPVVTGYPYAGSVPPPAQPYNPYQNPGQPTSGYPAGYPQPGYPVYYPPPPRPPLVSVETKAFLVKLMLSTVVIGTLFALVIVAVNAISTALQNYRLQAADQQIVSELRSLPAADPPEQRLARAEQLIKRLQDGARRAQEFRNSAVFLEELGRNAMSEGRLQDAETAFRDAFERDPSNPALASNLGYLYMEAARRESDPRQRESLLEAALRSWDYARKKATTPEAKRTYAAGAANARLSLALILNHAGDRDRARDLASQAQRDAPVGSTTMREAERLIRALKE
ncbi:MAG: protein kinase [Fimbriimonadaceae bacterium]